MSEVVSILVGLAGGVLLGALFFAGLWWTIRRGLPNRGAAVWFAASYLARFALVAGGLYAMARDDSARGIAACVGVIAVRVVVARFGPAASTAQTLAEKPQ